MASTRVYKGAKPEPAGAGVTADGVVAESPLQGGVDVLRKQSPGVPALPGCVTCVVTICDSEQAAASGIEQVTGYVSGEVVQALAGKAGDAATTRPALRMIQTIVLLSMGTISLMDALTFAGFREPRYRGSAGSTTESATRRSQNLPVITRSLLWCPCRAVVPLPYTSIVGGSTVWMP